MRYAKQNEDGSFTLGELAELFPDTSFPRTGPDADWLNENQVYLVDNILVFDPKAYKRQETEPTLSGGKVFTAELIPLTDEELAVQAEQAANSIKGEMRELRNRMLTACDWTQLADATVDKSAWGVYRQALRDVPSQAGFPATIEWPRSPNEPVVQQMTQTTTQTDTIQQTTQTQDPMPTGNVSL